MRLLAVAIAAWLLALGLLLLLTQPAPAVPAGRSQERPVDAALAPRSPTSPRDDAAAASEVEPAAVAESKCVRIRGRCVDEFGGAVRATVFVLAVDRHEVASDAGGAFELSLPRAQQANAASSALRLQANAQGRSSIGLRLPPLSNPANARDAAVGGDDTLDVGALLLPIAVAITVVVKTPNGAPVAHCPLSLQRTASGDEAGAIPTTEHAVTTDAFGTVVVDGVAASSDWQVRTVAGRPLLAPTAAFRPDRLPAGRLEVVVANLAADDTLVGVLRAADDAPVAGAEVLALGADEAPIANAVTDADGRFVLLRPATGAVVAMLGVADVAGHERLRVGPFAFGEHDVVLRLSATPRRRLRVVASDGSGAVTRFGWRWRTDGGSVERRGERAVEHHADGSAALDDVPSEPAWLDVLTDRDDAFAARHRILLPAATRELVVDLARQRTLLVRLRDPEGNAIAGSRIEALVDGAMVDAIATDGNGRAQLVLADGPSHVHVRATGDHLPAYADVRPGIGDVSLTASHGGSFAGALTPRTVLDELRRAGGGAAGLGLGVRLRMVPEDVGVERAQTVPIAADGTFAGRNLAPGRWTLVVDCHLALPDGALLRHELATRSLVVRDGDVSHFDLHLGDVRPGAVDCQVTNATSPLVVTLTRTDGDAPIAQLQTNATGALHVPFLPPGDYRAVANGRSVQFTVVAGGTVTVSLTDER